jgi:hypothetical protein
VVPIPSLSPGIILLTMEISIQQMTRIPVPIAKTTMI